MTESSMLKNTVRNLLLLISSAAALGLYCSYNIVSIMALGAVFIGVAVLVFMDKTRPKIVPCALHKLCYLGMTLYLGILGVYLFTLTWTKGGGYVHSVIDSLSFRPSNGSLLAGGALFILGFYALYVLSVFFVNMILRVLSEHLPRSEDSPKVNLRKNLFFVFSAMVFCVLAMSNALEYFMGLPLTLAFLVILGAKAPCVWQVVKSDSTKKRIFTLINALGGALAAREQFDYYISLFNATGPIKLILTLFSYLLVILSIYALYIFFSVFYKKFMEIIRQVRVFRDLRLWERVLYTGLLLLTIGYIIFAFVQTDVFYGTDIKNDIIYTADSQGLVKMNAFSIISHPENDLRQPLFAVFAMPFFGMVNLTRVILPPYVEAILLGAIQAGMILMANLMLTELMELSYLRRGCFMLLSCSCYTYLLFTLMLEQYAVAYFWLMLCIYLIVKSPSHSRFALFGSASTLLTSGVLTVPYAAKCAKEDKGKKLPQMLWCILRFVRDYVVLLILFCRFDIIINALDKINTLTHFTGKEITYLEKLYQYSHFLRNCFLPPVAQKAIVADHDAWIMKPITGLSILGIVILALAILGAVTRLKDQATRYAMGWTLFSFVMLFVLGWGTMENGLILYALYFSWAILALVFRLMEWIEDKLRVKFILPLLTLAGCAGMLMLNIPAMMDIINFGISSFPL